MTKILVYMFILGLVSLTGGQQKNCTGVRSPDDVCYTLHTGSVIWQAARAACRSQGGSLAAIVNHDQQTTMQYLLDGQGVTEAWIGASHTDGMWKWIGSGSLLLAQGCYTDRLDVRDMTREVTVSDLNPENCLQECLFQGYLYAATQGGRMCFCGNSYGRYGTNKVCTSACPAASMLSKWCGGLLMNFVYRINGAYGTWGFHQPNNHNGNQNCGILNYHTESKMADEDCLNTFGYLCEIGQNPCPAGTRYIVVNGHCFYFNENKVTWAQARSICQSLGGALVSIESEALYNTVKNVTTGLFPLSAKTWIGLHKEGGWTWDAGPGFSYYQWSTNYPIGLDNCGYIDVADSNKWKDTSCFEAKPYICQTVIGDYTQSIPSTMSGVSTTTNQISITTKSVDTRTTAAVRPTTSRGTATTTSRGTAITDVTPATTTAPGIPLTDTTPADSNDNTQTTQGLADATQPQAATGESQGLSTLEIALVALMCLLFLLLLILLIVCLLWKRKKNKISAFDGRPIAPVPNAGDDNYGYYDSSSTADLVYRYEPR